MWNTKFGLLYKDITKVLVILLTIGMIGGCSQINEVPTYDKKMLDEIDESETKELLEEESVELELVHLTSVTSGNMEIEATNKGYLYYPNKELILYTEPHLEATVVEVLVNIFEQVEEGDPIASVSYSIDSIELEKKKLAMKRSAENLAYAKVEASDELKLQKDKMDKELDPSVKDQERIIYNNRKQELDDMVVNMENEHKLVVEDTTNYESKVQLGYVTAPISGYIVELEKIKIGDIIKPYQYFGMIEEQSEVYLAIDNENGQFRYNMEVNIKVTERGNTKESKADNYKGIVMTASELLSWELKSPKTYIRLLDGNLEDFADKTIIVTGYTKQLKDVLLVDKTAVAFDKRISYVLHEFEGMTFKRNFVIGASDTDNYVVFDGLESNIEVRLGINQ